MAACNTNFSDANSDSSSTTSNISEFSESAEYRFLTYEITAGERINSKLLFTNDEKQLYYWNRSYASGDAWVCAFKGCTNRVHVRPDKMCVQKERYFNHKHENQEKKFNECKVLNIIKNKCADLSTVLNMKKQAVRDIFYSVLADYPDIKLDFFKCERGLQMIRSASLPKNPLNCNDVSKIFEREELLELLGTATTGETFYNGTLEGDDYGICVFSSAASIKLFESRIEYGERIMMMDGTFAVVPVGTFDQLLIIYGVYMEKVKFLKISLNFASFNKYLIFSIDFPTRICTYESSYTKSL